jgi:hypothetical protein
VLNNLVVPWLTVSFEPMYFVVMLLLMAGIFYV